MDIHKLINKYGSQAATARAFGVTRAAVQQWVKAGEIPQQRIWQMQADAVNATHKPYRRGER